MDVKEIAIYPRGPFANLLSLKDAATVWGISDSTLRKAIARGDLVAGVHVCKFGKQWVITVEAMERLTGKSVTGESIERPE